MKNRNIISAIIMKVITKIPISSPRWKHCVDTIKAGTEVEYNEKEHIIKHPIQENISIMLDKKKTFDKYFKKL